MIEVFKILHGYYNGIDKISLLPHVNTATRGNTYNCIKALSNTILESTFLLTEWCLYGIVYLILLWTLNLLIVLKVD